MKFRYFVVVISLFLSSSGFAEKESYGAYITGDKFIESCEEDNEASKQICAALISGTVDILSVLEATDDYRPIYCKPDGVTIWQLRRVVTKYLQDNPSKLHSSAAMLTYLALIEAFPCTDR